MPFDAQTVALILLVGVGAGWLAGLGDRAGGHVLAGIAGAALFTVLAAVGDLRVMSGDPMTLKVIIAVLGAGVGVLVSRFVLR
jgi:hypothetical protein